MVRKKIWLWSIVALSILPLIGRSQVKARVAGLESNDVYMKLLAEEQRLVQREDSVVRVIDKSRQLFGSTEGEERKKLGETILKLEDLLFDIRNQIGIVTGQANQIEQEFIVNNLDGAMPSENIQPTGAQSANLIENDYFKQNLGVVDYNALKQAQKNEKLIPDLIMRFAAEHGKAARMADAYRSATTPAVADSIYVIYQQIVAANKPMMDSIETIWRKIFEDKIYAYNYLLDRMNRSEELASFEDKAQQIRDRKSGISGLYVSDVIACYPMEKALLLGYEIKLAELLKLDQAKDSLNKAAARVDGKPIELPKLDVEERIFIRYQPIEFSSTPHYSSRNPIPEDTIYNRGTVYKILVGTYSQKQAPSIFRGAYPIWYHRTDDGRYRYCIGAYASLAEAEEAFDRMKERGFRKPQIVVWENGIYRNITEAQEDGEDGPIVLFRVEITADHGALPDEVRKTMTERAPDVEISRSSLPDGRYRFSIGTFDSKAIADEIADIVRSESGMDATVIEIGE